MNYRSLLLLIGLLTLAAGTLGSLQRTAQSRPSAGVVRIRPFQIEDEEYAVYSALINDNLKDEDEARKAEGTARKRDDDRVLIINANTSLWVGFMIDESKNFFDELKQSSTELQPETVNDLQVKSNGVSTLERKFSFKMKYALTSDEEIDSFFKEGVGGGWEAFHRKYPKSSGFLTFSRVGFNADKTQALVYKGFSCGGLCGGGGYTLLTKKKGVWVVGRSVGPTWVS
jgi:hypothetical protein